MPSTNQFKNYILEQLNKLDNWSFKQMMGEYLLYYNSVLFGGIYDNKLLIKITNSNKIYGLTTYIPYKNAKPMYIVENLEDTDYLITLIKKTYLELKNKAY